MNKKYTEISEQHFRDLWENNKRQITSVSLESQRERNSRMEFKKSFKEIMAENFPTLVKDINVQIQVAEQTPNMINTKNPHQDAS